MEQSSMNHRWCTLPVGTVERDPPGIHTAWRDSRTWFSRYAHYLMGRSSVNDQWCTLPEKTLDCDPPVMNAAWWASRGGSPVNHTTLWDGQMWTLSDAHCLKGQLIVTHQWWMQPDGTVEHDPLVMHAAWWDSRAWFIDDASQCECVKRNSLLHIKMYQCFFKPIKQILFLSQFRFASCCDIILIIAGAIVAVIAGTSRPATMIIFGQLIDKMINFSPNQNYNATIQNNFTRNNTM